MQLLNRMTCLGMPVTIRSHSTQHADRRSGMGLFMLGWTAPRHRVPELGCEQPRPEPSSDPV
jgi:hypothetical protein